MLRAGFNRVVDPEKAMQLTFFPSNSRKDGNARVDGAAQNALNNIAYSMDALVPGFYLWVGPLVIQLGGCQAEPSYPGTVHSRCGIGIVFPGYHLWTSYTGSFDA